MSALLCRFSAVLFLLILWIDNIGAKEVRIVCYYTNWSVYRPGDAKFNPQNINPYLCTHLIYAFGGFTKENTLKPFDKYQDIEKGGYAKFVGLKTYNKNLKTLLAIGGWNEGSTRFSPMVASTDRRKELIKNTIKFLRQNHFDGLDLDWEYPSFRDGGKPRDRDNYAQLVQELREEFERESEKTGRPRLLLTMAVPAGIEYIKKGYDVPKLTKYLDWMNILSYDYHSAYEPAVNHHSPLYPIEEESEYSYDIDLNIDYTIKHYIQSGADKSKLVLGIPTYGRSYTLYNPDANEIGAPADGPGEMGDATRENGYLAYYEICENIKSADWQVESPFPDMMGPYAYKDDQWVSYDDEDIARRKSEYVAEHGLGGIMFWSIDNDDFRGKCGDRPYPIIEAAKEALLKAYGLSDSNLLEATKKPIKSRTRSRTRGTTKALSTTEAAIVSNSGGRQTLRRKPHRISGKSDINTTKRRRRPSARKTITSTTTTEGRLVGSSLLVTPSYTTPSPPSTPDSGGDFKCEDEGFFPHPKDCKKYFWCLSGPSDLGIIAHQFTCPAGLYFNKAASSCDYTQNVLCNKKISKSSTKTTTAASSTSTTTSTSSSIFSTRRPPPKITAATSRTTFTSTTAAPEYEEEYEYYDEDEDDSPSNDAEEDPRVIKELIDLIKKAGGLDELEKQLKLQDEKQSTVNEGSTTQGSLSKSLFQRVLGRTTLRNTLSKTTPRYDVINRNSRGPQTNGIAKSSEEKIRSKSRPEYTSIIRSRPSTVATTGEDDDNINEERTKQDVKENTTEDTDLSNETDEDDAKQSRVPYRKSQPEYVTIRRQRISTTTAGVPEEEEEEETGRSFSRSPFKQLGEDNEFVEDTEENDKIVRNTLRSSTTSTPYVTIRRSRPTTTATETIDEQIDNSGIRKRGNGTLNNETTSNPSSGFEYVTVRRQRPEVEPTTSKYVEIRTRGTTTAFPTTDSEASNTEPPPTTITQLRSTTVTTEKELTTLSVDEIVVLDDSSSNNTNSEIDTSNLVEENRVESISNEVTENAKTDDKRNDVLEIVNIDKVASNTEKPNEQITTTIATPNEESVTYKRRGTQAPRPAFHLRRTTVAPVTTTAETPTTLPTSKKPSRPYIFRPIPHRNITSFISTTTKSTDLGTFTSNKPYVRRKQKPTASTIIENQGYSSGANKLFTSTESIRKHYFRNRFTTNRTPLVHISTAKISRFSVDESQQYDQSTNSNKQEDAVVEEPSDPNGTPIKLHEIQEALTRHKNVQTTTTVTVPRTTRVPLTKLFASSTKPIIISPISTPTTPFPLTTQRIILRNPKPHEPEDIMETKTRRKITPYEFRDSDFTDILPGLPEHSKVVIHSGGIIQCLDQGNFPHPVSCKKFISCAKMETGKVVGWEYTCPKNLSFDPVGGMCNWSADLGCDE